MTKAHDISRTVMDLVGTPETPDELFHKLTAVAFTIGGMCIHFQPEDRSRAMMNLTESLARGLMDTSAAMGEPCDMEIVVGEKERQ